MNKKKRTIILFLVLLLLLSSLVNAGFLSWLKKTLTEPQVTGLAVGDVCTDSKECGDNNGCVGGTCQSLICDNSERIKIKLNRIKTLLSELEASGPTVNSEGVND